MSHLSIVTTARRTESLDAKEIIKFVNHSTIELFGPQVREPGRLFELMYATDLNIAFNKKFIKFCIFFKVKNQFYPSQSKTNQTMKY